MNTELLFAAIDFYNEGNSLAATAKKFHSTPNTLKKLFAPYNVYIRSQGEQCIIENIRRTKKINHFYFSELDNEKSYYLGFIAADGTVRKERNEIKICLSSIDKDFLENMKNKMESEQKIKTYTTNNGFECCVFTFSSRQIKQDLMQYGIVPNKTYVGISLKKIPQKYQLAFIKGFFDGDGCFSYNHQTKQGKVSFTSHTKTILEELKEYIGSGNIYQDKRNKVYSLEISTKASLELLNKFYELDTPYLTRKKKKYLDFLNLRNNIPRDKAPSTEG